MKAEFHMTTSCTVDPAERRRRLAAVYKLLLSIAEKSQVVESEQPDPEAHTLTFGENDISGNTSPADSSNLTDQHAPGELDNPH